mgnify:CR=1 FL=1
MCKCTEAKLLVSRRHHHFDKFQEDKNFYTPIYRPMPILGGDNFVELYE